MTAFRDPNKPLPRPGESTFILTLVALGWTLFVLGVTVGFFLRMVIA